MFTPVEWKCSVKTCQICKSKEVNVPFIAAHVLMCAMLITLSLLVNGIAEQKNIQVEAPRLFVNKEPSCTIDKVPQGNKCIS